MLWAALGAALYLLVRDPAGTGQAVSDFFTSLGDFLDSLAGA